MIPAPTKTGHVALLILLSGYVLMWLVGTRGMLIDPTLQTDDVRTYHFAFHRYAGNEAMATDPIATEMLNFMPPAVHLLYRIIVPFTGVPASTKVVQGLCILILFLATYLLARKGGPFLASAALLLFFVLHTKPLMGSIAGGLQRAFAGFRVWSCGLLGLLSRVPTFGRRLLC